MFAFILGSLGLPLVCRCFVPCHVYATHHLSSPHELRYPTTTTTTTTYLLPVRLALSEYHLRLLPHPHTARSFTHFLSGLP